MEFHILPILAFLSVVAVSAASHGALSPEAYWKSVLPNTPMPKAVKDLLPNGRLERVGKGLLASTVWGSGREGWGVGLDEWMEDKGTSVGKPVYLTVTRGKVSDTFVLYGAIEDQLHYNPNVALFFMEKDLKKGTKMPLYFTKSTTPTTFLPRQVAEKIPFSSDKMSKIMNYFSVKPDSKEADIMKKTIKECEEPGTKGEEKYCATSLESMVDFSTNKLGKNVQGLLTEVDRETQLQKYSITGVEKMAGDKTVVCHKQEYAYAVFYCHKKQTTKAYVVSLLGADGTKVKAVAVCHMDTSAWNPKHLAFQVLKVKPGTVPICHFLSDDDIVWVPK
ncbi:BURP domain-containing protein [Actinidia rufa]|uniref:BURP domain-containing protein n=1 Tax=Actinidia rufa TaxID=165716 RepID=A0A7J0DIP7_9ERIC|nr:BURP domain-containing protein [Actinidia rufa]